MRPPRPLEISRRFWRVWLRNWTVYRRIWQISFLPPLLEPLLYLLAFGVGMGALVGKVRFEGVEVPYLEFIAPAILATTMMYNSFFETTYASFVRMYYQRTFDAMLAAPLTLDEIITGEIVWGATKAVIAGALTLAVVSLFGLARWPHALLTLPVALLGGLAFASVGMLFTGLVPHIETFNLPVFLFITPMFLFSGTFFPLDALPPWAQHAAAALPMTHLVALVRALCRGSLGRPLLVHAAYLACFAALFFPVALLQMRRRLIK